MSYDARELSIAGGEPIELWRWQMAGEYYRYTSAEDVQAGDDGDYAPAAIQRGAISQDEEIGRAALEVQMPADLAPAQLFSAGPPVDQVQLRVWRRHRGDAELVVLWQGRVLSCQWQGAVATLVHEPVWTAIRRAGLRRTWGRQCPHVLYGPACRAVRVPVTAPVDELVSTVVVRVSAAGLEADGYYAGGLLARADPLTGRTHRAMIIGHTGQYLELHYPLPLVAGQLVEVSAGCDHTLATCEAKFANSANFGGFPNTPTISPYGGSSIY